jgi:transposase
LVPPDQVTQTHVLKPCTCRRCGAALTGDDPHPYRHQVIDIPKVTATVEEFQLQELACRECGTLTRAALPMGVPEGQFGPRLQATVGVCSGDYHMSKRDIEVLVEDFFGVRVALGSVPKLEQLTSEAIKGPVEEVARAIQQEPIVYADETGWYEGSKRAWIWAAVTGTLAVFLIRARRSTKVAKELLGAAFAGFLVSDRWRAYLWVDVARRQLCWAHLLRQFRGFQDYGPDAKAIGEALETLTDTMFAVWHRVRDGTTSRAEFQTFIERLRPVVVARLREGESCAVEMVAGRCREIMTLEPALWTFARVEGIEPTNNTAERVLRPAVLWRNVSFGTDSPRGSRFVERILTVVSTLRLQRRNVLDYVAEACRAHQNAEAPPSLLPL